MTRKKAFYKYGDNLKFDYIVIDTKENAIEKEVSEDSLIYKLFRETKVKVSEFGDFPFGNFDLILEKQIKTNNEFCGLLLVHEDDIELLD